MRVHRYAVVGGGGIGSAAAYWLSRRAKPGEVVCLEQYELGHRHGASEDHSRIIRLGYHAARYTALTRAAYAAWRTVEEASGVPLVHRTGALNIAHPDTEGGRILDAYVEAMDGEAIPHERLDAAELMRRWPQFRVPPEHEALFQRDGGILDIRKGCAVHVALARANGAVVVPQATVSAIRSHADGVVLDTAAGTVRAEHVLLCAGAWNRDLLAGLGVHWPIELMHQQVTYFATAQLRAFAPDRFPIWIWHGADEGEFYGFPVFGEVATKAAEDLGGAVIAAPPAGEPDPEQVERVRRFLDGILPGSTGPELYTRCCLYDMPPDRDFVIDAVPGHPRVLVAVGAGHAAKFAGLIGRVLAELAIDGGTTEPIEPFRADRPALTDPGFSGAYRLGGAIAT